MDEQLAGVDFALAAYREAGEWQVRELAHDLIADIDTIAYALRRLLGDSSGGKGGGGAVAFVAMDEDFFLIIRVVGPRVLLLLSDITAAEEWELASSAVDYLGLPQPEQEDDQVPAGDLDLLGDLGMNGTDMAELLDEFDLYPDEMLSEIARHLGFGELFDETVGLTPA